MYNKQLYIYRQVRDTTLKLTKYEDDPVCIVDAYAEPAGLSAVAPMEATIGQPYTIFIKSLQKLQLRDGFKLVNPIDNDDYYIVTSVIEAFEFNNEYDYQLSAYKPKPEQIEVE